ncbi:MAG TPA: ABC transporter substrate-binding protein [Nocardioides sp.]|nr:ABC transporter substrate-binding protein [Nocardioides sp.]
MSSSHSGRRPRLLPVLSVLTMLGLSACGAASGASGSDVGIGYFQSATIGSEVLVAGNSDLSDKVGADIKLTPIDSGVAGLAELRGGAFPFVSGVGNPPVVGAIAQDTPLKVVYAEYFDAAQLIVPSSVTANQQLAGKTVGDLQGSSEDFEIRGWLEKQGLSDQVKVVGFPSEAAVAAAYKAHRIDAAYVEIAQALDLVQHAGGRSVVTAEQIARLGYPSLNVLAVTESYAAKNPDRVQALVCQVMRAQSLMSTPKADQYIGNGAHLVGATPDEAVAATKVIPWVKASDELSWFTGPSGDVADGKIAKAYALTAQFLVDQGRVSTVPTAAQIADHLDASYVKQALKDGCDQ